jgi:RNA polymerase sigma factor for flagellar operon FliA
MLDALGKFDPSKQVLFRTYAQSRIRGAILDSLRALDWSPRELRQRGRDIEVAIRTLTGELSRSPTEIEIAQKLNLPLIAYQQLLGELKGLEIGSLHSRCSEDPDEEVLNYLPSRLEDDPLFRFQEAEMRERLTKAIEDLPERERVVINLYYCEEMSMREIGTILDVTESRVSQIRASAVLHLRARLVTPGTREEPRKQDPPVKQRCMLPSPRSKSS